ncbi:MAG: NUDIX hydrolase [Planctomycetaceae bacterium]
MTDELFDVVDAADRVIGQLPRSEVHRRGLLHRAVQVFVFNSRGELLIHRRSATKDECPLLWTSSASGHVAAGESYDDCAPREMREEIALSAPLERLAKFPASAETSNEHTVLYRAVTDDAPRFDPVEIAQGTFLPLITIAEMIAADPLRFTPVFRLMFRWYRENG